MTIIIIKNINVSAINEHIFVIKNYKTIKLFFIGIRISFSKNFASRNEYLLYVNIFYMREFAEHAFSVLYVRDNVRRRQLFLDGGSPSDILDRLQFR